MIEKAMNRLAETNPANAQADITKRELAQIHEQIVRIAENALAFRVTNALIIRDAPVDEGVVRMLQLIQADINDAADILNGLV